MRPVIPTMLNGIFLLMKKKVIIQNEVNQNNDIFPADFYAFRYAEKTDGTKPGAKFEITFQLKNMSAEKNEKFSLLPMLFVVGCKGFYSKYWLVNAETNTCRGIYQWDSLENAIAYSKSFAVKFMSMRSVKGSIEYHVSEI